jgi:hypothetical protein
VKRAMQRHEAGEAKVIPIILRPVDWEGAPFSKLQGVPKDGRAVTLWDNYDEAFVSVVTEIRRALRELSMKPGEVGDRSPSVVIDPRLTSSARARKWLRIVAVILPIIFLVVVFYRLNGGKSWGNLFSNGSATETPTPAPAPTPTLTPAPTPSVDPTPGQPSPSPSVQPPKNVNRTVKSQPKSTPDPYEQSINRFFDQKKKKKNAHASATQSTTRVTFEELKDLLATASKSKRALQALKNGLRQTGVNFVLTSQVEEEIRVLAADYSKADLDALIALIRANDWKKSEEARQISPQIARDIAQLSAEFEAISLTDLDLATRTYNDLLNKCSTVIGGVDTQVRKFDLISRYQRDWNRYRKPWQRETREEFIPYEALNFKNEIEGSVDLLKTFIEQIKRKINNAILGLKETT